MGYCVPGGNWNGEDGKPPRFFVAVLTRPSRLGREDHPLPRMVSTSVSPTYQSRAATSSKTTQTSFLAKPVAAVIASVTALLIEAFLPLGSAAMTSLTMRILTKGMGFPLDLAPILFGEVIPLRRDAR